jgi:hypothetical protein
MQGRGRPTLAVLRSAGCTNPRAVPLGRIVRTATSGLTVLLDSDLNTGSRTVSGPVDGKVGGMGCLASLPSSTAAATYALPPGSVTA